MDQYSKNLCVYNNVNAASFQLKGLLEGYNPNQQQWQPQPDLSCPGFGDNLAAARNASFVETAKVLHQELSGYLGINTPVSCAGKAPVVLDEFGQWLNFLEGHLGSTTLRFVVWDNAACTIHRLKKAVAANAGDGYRLKLIVSEDGEEGIVSLAIKASRKAVKNLHTTQRYPHPVGVDVVIDGYYYTILNHTHVPEETGGDILVHLKRCK